MAYNDHPIIQEGKSLVLNGDAFYNKDQIVTRFSRLNPGERVEFIRGGRAKRRRSANSYGPEGN
jgi:hypothetical protein